MMKKGKSKGKGKGKGKKGGKKKKDKKDKKPKSAKEVQYREAITNAKVWEARLESTEKSRLEYRENVRRLVHENDDLQKKMAQNEKDTVEVLSFLKREDVVKDDQMSKLQQQLKDFRREGRVAIEATERKFAVQIEAMDASLVQKDEEIEALQVELKQVKHFRQNRAQMQKQMEELQNTIDDLELQNKQSVMQLEQRYLEEKARLQQEASRKVEELAAQAHDEAVRNLDETTKSVYKENISLSEAITYHTTQSEQLQSKVDTLASEIASLKDEKELNGMLVQKKVVESKKHKRQIKELREKVETLEQTLTQVVREFEVEKEILRRQTEAELKNSRDEISRLQRQLEMRNKETNHIKLLAKNLLLQRSDVETFFLDALEHVKKEISINRAEYRKHALVAYQKSVAAAQRGEQELPRVRTFRLLDQSTNSVYKDLEQAESWSHVSSKVDVGDLTWEQKEQLLRFLFAKMNGQGKQKRKAEHSQHSLVPLTKDEDRSEQHGESIKEEQTFITQQGETTAASTVVS
ncbi:basal body-orientation factor 1-like [Corticium candelabrum]|uniref:basal body-orientation factor 1-like n=1 Tax=Corticium candelabrum TaxID=121492 RepID=UPI002E260D27|nr:basal body-orientation factor 1-like [Corticium candelabrum]